MANWIIVCLAFLVSMVTIEGRIGQTLCSKNTDLCDPRNNEICNGNTDMCTCKEKYFAIADKCAKLCHPKDRCGEGICNDGGKCDCYYSYTRKTDNNCGVCTKDSDCVIDRGISSNSLSKCVNVDGYLSKCMRPCQSNSDCNMTLKEVCGPHGIDKLMVCNCKKGLIIGQQNLKYAQDGFCASGSTILPTKPVIFAALILTLCHPTSFVVTFFDSLVSRFH